MILSFAAAALASAAPTIPADLGNGWKVANRIDPMNDDVTAQATFSSADGQIAFACAVGSPEWMNFAAMPKARVSVEGGERIRYRFDQGSAEKVVWSFSNGTGAPIPGYDARKFIAGARNATTLLIRIPRYNDLDLDVRFDMTGAGAAIAALEEACKAPRR